MLNRSTIGSPGRARLSFAAGIDATSCGRGVENFHSTSRGNVAPSSARTPAGTRTVNAVAAGSPRAAVKVSVRVPTQW